MKNIFKAKKGNNQIVGGIVILAAVIILLALLFPVINAIQTSAQLAQKLDDNNHSVMYESQNGAQNTTGTTMTLVSILPLVLGAGLIITGLMVGLYYVISR